MGTDPKEGVRSPVRRGDLPVESHTDRLLTRPVDGRFSMSTLREHAGEYARRIQAYERVFLRRWLRSQQEVDDLPKHLYLNWDLDWLKLEVSKWGGSVEAILQDARDEIVKRITEGR